MSNIQIAKKFASLLDRNDFTSAKQYMAKNCIYHYNGQVIRGRDAIIQSYSDNYEKAARELDEVIFYSDIAETDDPSCFTAYYLDRIRKGRYWHDHRCEQALRFESGRIVEITHRDLPGESAALKKFLKKAGMPPPRPS